MRLFPIQGPRTRLSKIADTLLLLTCTLRDLQHGIAEGGFKVSEMFVEGCVEHPQSVLLKRPSLTALFASL